MQLDEVLHVVQDLVVIAVCGLSLLTTYQPSHRVQDLVVATGRAIHLLTDGRHVSKDRRVQQRCTRQQNSPSNNHGYAVPFPKLHPSSCSRPSVGMATRPLMTLATLLLALRNIYTNLNICSTVGLL